MEYLGACFLVAGIVANVLEEGNPPKALQRRDRPTQLRIWLGWLGGEVLLENISNLERIGFLTVPTMNY